MYMGGNPRVDLMRCALPETSGFVVLDLGLHRDLLAIGRNGVRIYASINLIMPGITS
jgi:hypothetical protein